MQFRGVDELGHDLVQTGILASRIDGGRDQIELAVRGIEKCQPGMGAADVARQNHFSKFLQ